MKLDFEEKLFYTLIVLAILMCLILVSRFAIDTYHAMYSPECSNGVEQNCILLNSKTYCEVKK